MNQNEPNVFSIPLASCIANGHVNAGLDCYRKFEVISESGKIDYIEALTLALPAITNMALGIEVQLKLLHFQISSSYPYGHNIERLFEKLPQKHRTSLAKRYLALYSDPAVSKGLEFRLNLSDGGAKKGEWKATDLDTVQHAVRYLGRTYERWRYIYEEFSTSLDIEFQFAPLYFVSKSLESEIREFEGSTRITVSRTDADT